MRATRRTCTYLGLSDVHATDVCRLDIAYLATALGRELTDAVHAVVRVRAEDVRAARAEGERLADELERGAGVRGEYDGVAGWGTEEVEDGLACLAG